MSIQDITLDQREIPRTGDTKELTHIGKPENEGMKPSSLDEQRPKACSFTKESSRGTKTGRVLYSLHHKLRDSLNFQAVHPFLSRARLIPVNRQREFIPNIRDDAQEECLTQLLNLSKHINNPDLLEKYLDAFSKLTSLNNPTTRHDQVDRLLLMLSQSKDAKCMEKFIQCLRDSSNESYAGESHLELAEDLAAAWKKEPDLSITLEISEAHDPPLQVTVGGRYKRRFENIQTSLLPLCSAKFLCCLAFPLALVLFGIVATAIISRIPSVQTPDSDSALSVVAQGSDIVELRLADSFNLQLLSSVELELGQYSSQQGTCSGTVHVLRRIECADLNTTSRTRSSTMTLMEFRVRFTPQLLYLLPGSEITVTIDPVNVITDFVSIVRGLEMYRKCNSELCSCDFLRSFPSSLYRCFNVSEYRDAPITFQVNASDYYSVFESSGGYIGLSWSVFEVLYDLSPSANVDNEELLMNSFNTTTELRANVLLNNNFNFDPPSCILYQSKCPVLFRDAHANLTITSVQRRQDIILFPGLFLICALFLVCMVAFISCVVLKRRVRTKSVKNDDNVQ